MGQPRIERAHLGKLNLDPRFVGSGVLGENIKDELAAVDDLTRNDLFDVAHLARSKVRVENKSAAVRLLYFLRYFFKLAGTDKRGSDRARTLLDHDVHDLGARGRAQHAHFFHVDFKKLWFVLGCLKSGQNDPFKRRRIISIEHLKVRSFRFKKRPLSRREGSLQRDYMPFSGIVNIAAGPMPARARRGPLPGCL